MNQTSKYSVIFFFIWLIVICQRATFVELPRIKNGTKETLIKIDLLVNFNLQRNLIIRKNTNIIHQAKLPTKQRSKAETVRL